MITQRVTPVRSNDSVAYHVGKTALDEMLARCDKSSPLEEAADVLDESDAIPLGLAVNTRNYQALLDNLARSSSSVASGSVSPSYRRQSLGPLCALTPSRKSPLRAAGAGQEEEDCTVLGLPVETRNYEAMVSGTCSARADPTTKRNGRATVSSVAPIPTSRSDETVKTGVVGKEETSAKDGEEDDAVMGLPISTGNYVAYLAGQEGSGLHPPGHRHRGYSNLASEKDVREPSVSDPYLSSSRRGRASYDSNTAPSKTDQKDVRPSCFDSRRASNAVVVPHAGWVFIQRGAFRTWKRYYAVLSGTEFKYSKGVGQSPKGFGLLMSVKRMEDVRYGLCLEFGDGDMLQIRCPSDREYDEWLGAMERAIERNQSLTSRSRTTYTPASSEQHEGYLFKQDKNKAWKRCYFVVRTDGYIECRDSQHSAPDRKCSGYIKAVSFADCHANGLAIQLSSDVSMVCYADSYDEQMLWYGAISAAASANGKEALPYSLVKSCYVQTALSNHAGWLYKQAGIFKGWKRLYFTLHGAELAYAKDTNSETVLCDKVHSVEEWEGHANGLLIRLMSERVWKVHAETYDTAKRWRSIISSTCRHAEKFNLKKYLNSRRRKKLNPVFGGWLTEVKKGSRLRRFFVMDGAVLGVANDVDNQLERLGTVVDVGATRDLECGMVFTLSDGKKIKVNCDSLADSRCWYECLTFSLK